jgi:hypothetical protein
MKKELNRGFHKFYFYVCTMVINDIILEIKNYKSVSTHKAALDIYRLLEGSKGLFLEKMNPDDFNHLLTSFENLTYGNQKYYNTASYKREYTTLYDLLLFYLDRIV